jgi:hypothetical protein
MPRRKRSRKAEEKRNSDSIKERNANGQKQTKRGRSSKNERLKERSINWSMPKQHTKKGHSGVNAQ